LINAPNTFQKYINWILREYLNDFVSAYIDDILIYTNGSRSEYRQHVRKILAKLYETGLQLNIDKSEFEVKSTKYLGFIIKTNKGVRMDSAKIEAVLKWEAPRSVKGV
jgi:ribosome-interacting GTPase 1